MNPKTYNFLLKALNRTFQHIPAHLLYSRKKASIHAPVFIIGVPRSGSTILYQAITATMDIGYINNLICSLYNSLPLGFKLSKYIYSNSTHTCFNSSFGHTTDYGYNAPSECGSFWYRWLPRDKHFIDWNDFDRNIVHKIRQEVYSASNIIKRPIVFKNLNAGQRLRLISRTFPNARIIHIKREAAYNIQSILKARRNNNIPEHSWWSIKPPYYTSYLNLSEIKMCTAQYKGILKQIDEDRKLFPENQWKDIEYENFIDDPQMTIESLMDFLDIPLRSNTDLSQLLQNIKGKQERSLSEEEWKEVLHSVEYHEIEEKCRANTQT